MKSELFLLSKKLEQSQDFDSILSTFQPDSQLDPLIKLKDDYKNLDDEKTLLNTNQLGLDSPMVEFERLLKFQRIGEESLGKLDVMAHREHILLERLDGFRRLMVMFYTAESMISIREKQSLMTIEQIRAALTSGKQDWVIQLI